MRLPIWITLASWLSVGLSGAVLAAQDADQVALRRHHPWGCFPAGAWKVVRGTTETLDEKGTVVGSSTTETKTTLDAIDSDGVTLFIEGVVEVAGKRLEAGPQCVRQGFRGESAKAKTKVTILKPEELVIEGRRISCQVEELEEITETNRTVTRVYFSPTVRPYVLKRTSVTTDLEGQTRLGETTVTVVGLDLPWKVLAEIKSATLVHAVRKHAKGTTDTWVITSVDVPGGVVQHASKELDQNGRLLRRSTLELVDYGRQPDEERTGIFRRRRANRLRRP